MGDYVPGLVVAGVGVLLLMVLVAVTAGAVHRFTRARTALERSLARGAAELRANAPRRSGDGAVTPAGRDRPHP